MSGTQGTAFEGYLVVGPSPLSARKIGKEYYAHTGFSKENHADMKWTSNHKGDLKDAVKVALNEGRTIVRVELNDTRQPCPEHCAIQLPIFAKAINKELRDDLNRPDLATIEFFAWTYNDDDGGRHVYYIDQEKGATTLIGDW
jgi:formylmethanofuran dehydrogenase subunit D